MPTSVVMVPSSCVTNRRVHASHWMNADSAPSCWPSDQVTDLGCKSTCSLSPSTSSITIYYYCTRPKSWWSFCHPTDVKYIIPKAWFHSYTVLKYRTNYTHNRFTALFPGPPGWAGAWRELLDFMVQGKINRGRHTNNPAGRHSIRTNQCPPPPSRPEQNKVQCRNILKSQQEALVQKVSAANTSEWVICWLDRKLVTARQMAPLHRTPMSVMTSSCS